MSRLPRRDCRARNSSLSTRFIRLRSTARGKTRLGTIRPSLGTPRGFVRRSTLNPGRLSARPPASRAAISAVPSRSFRLYRLRTLKRSTGRGPWHGGPESRRGLRACAYVREIRECASCERRKGGKYASSTRDFYGEKNLRLDWIWSGIVNDARAGKRARWLAKMSGFSCG